ncbi:MAG: MtnX-like HAD-IB family phosphatase [Deltaproteobacteria bacterium]|jgi:2,3-diketo-5-methylthio-1-phosphopentane phosphatase|nr:MtnX-like HAD-IB family phosphatase [Deltaproteobacteria bacterium]
MTLFSSSDIICDFDGTVTPVDTTDLILSRFALPQWEEIESQWVSGLISSRECMCRQVGLLRTDEKSLNALIDEIPLADGFEEFMLFAKNYDLRLHIVSDGLDYVIRRILSNYGISGIPVTANRLMMTGDRYELEFPHSQSSCGSGVCKCAVAEEIGQRIFLIGDGRTDICLSDHADMILSRRGMPLESHCREMGLPYHSFSDFYDVVTFFENCSGTVPDPGQYLNHQAIHQALKAASRNK